MRQAKTMPNTNSSIERPRRNTVLVFTSLIIIAAAAMLPFVIIARVMPSWYAADEVEGALMAEFSDGHIRYQDVGTGDTTFLFLHGFNGHLGQWHPVWRELEACACRRLRIDIPGFGESDWRTDDFGVQEQAQRIVALLDRLGIRRVVLVGTSMGASISAWIASHYPERVEQVVLMAPSGFPGSLTYPGLFGRLVRPGVLNSMATWIARTPLYGSLFPRSRALQALTVTASYGAPWQAALGQIRAPTLILWSRGDTTAASDAAERVHHAIPGSTLILLDEATGHSIPNSRPELVARVLELLAAGIPPADISATVPRDLWRPGEGPTQTPE